jgi:hypothetical protein
VFFDTVIDVVREDWAEVSSYVDFQREVDFAGAAICGREDL